MQKSRRHRFTLEQVTFYEGGTYLDELHAKMVRDIKVLAKGLLQGACALGTDAGEVEARAGEAVWRGHHKLHGLGWGGKLQWRRHRRCAS